MNKNKLWIKKYIVFFSVLFFGGLFVNIFTDPFFHYHGPLSILNYNLNDSDERYINDGITKHFKYDAIITGTSMTENFLTSELDELFNVTSIKVPFKGARFKEINDNLKVAFNYHDDIKIVVRSLDMGSFYSDSAADRSDLGVYPTYLYDDNIFNDVEYVLNKDVLLENTLPTLISGRIYSKKGKIDFDGYRSWRNIDGNYGAKSVLSVIEENGFVQPAYVENLTNEQKQKVIENIKLNVTDLAREHPETTFYYFFPPYSVAWWGCYYSYGWLERQFECEQIVIEEILQCSNIKLFSYNNCYDITTNLNNYCDSMHYAGDINDWILQTMADGQHQITTDNYVNYLTEEYQFYSTYDYNALFYQ